VLICPSADLPSIFPPSTGLKQICPSASGLAAGFDKNAEAIEGILGFGFGFVEIGDSEPP
jgi:dihydroorotate dehydrogenase